MKFLSTHTHLWAEEDRLSSNQKISCDEVTLFREAMQGVSPLADSGKAVLIRSERQPFIRPNIAIQPITQHSQLDAPSVVEGEKYSFVRPGLQYCALRKLRRGRWPVQDELDLHGYNRNEAYRILIAFLDAVIQQKYRCVRVIHGRGLSSKNHKAVLKKRVGGWLMQVNDVLAFCQAQSSQGGSGALLVLLRNLDR